MHDTGAVVYMDRSVIEKSLGIIISYTAWPLLRHFYRITSYIQRLALEIQAIICPAATLKPNLILVPLSGLPGPSHDVVDAVALLALGAFS